MGQRIHNHKNLRHWIDQIEPRQPEKLMSFHIGLGRLFLIGLIKGLMCLIFLLSLKKEIKFGSSYL